jgi:hypothetical protein
MLGTQLGTPRGRYDEHSSKSFLSMKPRFIKPVGERTNFRRLMLAGLVTAPDNLYMVPYLGLMTHKYRGYIVVLLINKSVEPTKE